MTSRDITEENVKFIAEALGVSESKFWYKHDKGSYLSEWNRYEQRPTISYRPSVNSNDSEFREHEIKCITHKNLVMILKNALEQYESPDYQTQLLPDWQDLEESEKDTFYFNGGHYGNPRLPRLEHQRSDLVKTLEKRSRKAAYEKVGVGGLDGYWEVLREMYRAADIELESLESRFSTEEHRIDNLPKLEQWEFFNSKEQYNALNEMKKDVDEKRKELKSLFDGIVEPGSQWSSDRGLCRLVSEEALFTVGIKKGGLNYDLHREYVKAKKQFTKELEALPNRINAALAELEANVPQDYETFVKETTERREKERLAEELRLENERQAKLAEEKKQREDLLNQLELTGLGLGEKGKDGKEKRSFASRNEAEAECIRLIGKYKKLLRPYRKEFCIPGGKPIERWFITSQVA